VRLRCLPRHRLDVVGVGLVLFVPRLNDVLLSFLRSGRAKPHHPPFGAETMIIRSRLSTGALGEQ
jgi:hypothetical protein